MTKLLQTSLLLATLWLAPFNAMAAGSPVANSSAPNWYSVELMVFRYTDPQAGSLETWPVNPGIPDWNSAVALTPADPSPAPFQELPPASYRLDNAWQKLGRSNDYQLLLHLAWMQPVAERDSAPAVRIGVPPVTAPGATSAPVAATAAIIAAASAGNSAPVYGIAKLSTTGPYLHFDLDLLYRGVPAKISIPDTSQQPPPGTPTPTFQWYRLGQDRRIDAGKLNYFDHPMFGVLMLVTPIKKQQ